MFTMTTKGFNFVIQLREQLPELKQNYNRKVPFNNKTDKVSFISKDIHLYTEIIIKRPVSLNRKHIIHENL